MQQINKAKDAGYARALLVGADEPWYNEQVIALFKDNCRRKFKIT